MENSINMVIIGLIMAGGAYMFPEYIVCTDTNVLVIAVLVIIVVSRILDGVYICITAKILATGYPMLAVPCCIALIIISKIEALIIADRFVQGFDIVGVWTYIALVALMMIVRCDRNEV